jgi:large subunit ribosomal protein L20
MPRVKRGKTHVKRRERLHKKVKGFKWGRKNLIRAAKIAATKAGAHSYVGRKKKKRTNRGLWQIRISAFAKEQGLSYSSLMGKLKKADIKLDRKILADLAINNKQVLAKIIEQVK